MVWKGRGLILSWREIVECFIFILIIIEFYYCGEVIGGGYRRSGDGEVL